MSTEPSEARRIFTERLRRELRGGRRPHPRRLGRPRRLPASRLPAHPLRSHAAPAARRGARPRRRAPRARSTTARPWAGRTGPCGASRPMSGTARCDLSPARKQPGLRWSATSTSSRRRSPGRSAALWPICPASGRRPTDQSADELADTLQAVLWLSRIPGISGLPDAGELQHSLERARLLQPLERLARGHVPGAHPRTRGTAQLHRPAHRGRGRCRPNGTGRA